MKKTTKIALWVIGSFVVAIIVALLSVNIWVTVLVQKKVHKAVEKIPNADAMVGNIFLSLLSGSAIVTDITFATNSLAIEDSVSGVRQPGLAIHIPTLSIWNINYYELLRHNHLAAYKITLDDPGVIVYLDEEHPEALLPALPKDTTLEKAKQWLDSADIYHLEIENLKAKLHSTHTPLLLEVDSLNVKCRDLRYNFTDSVFAYNDSVYSLTIGSFVAKLPDAVSELEAHQVATSDQGPVKLGYTRYRNIISAKKLADLYREPTTWIDLELNGVSTSSINPIRKALAKDFTLDSLRADVKRMHVFRDARHKPKTPFLPPQDYIEKSPVDFSIKHINALAHKVDVEFASTNINCGELHVKNVRADLSNITNKRGAVWNCNAKAPFGKQGNVDAKFLMTLNKAANFELQMKAQNVEINDLNTFLRPLVGITCDCHINQLDADYKGNRSIAKGEFCMQYTGLHVKVHKEDDIPYKIVTKHADTFTNLANSLIPKSNPTAVDICPRSYMVEWKRDEWSPYPLYLFGPCIDGVIKTMLPGLFVHKQTKNKKK